MSSDSDSDSGLSADELAPSSGTIVQVTDFSKVPFASNTAGSAASRTAGSSSSRSDDVAAAADQGSDSESDDDHDDDDEGSLSSDESSEEELDNLRLRRDSKLFSPYRTVGLVTNQTPFQFNAMGKDSFVTVCLGRSWQVLRADSLATSIVSRRLRENIRALAVKRTLTWGAVGRDIMLWKRARRVRRIRDAHDRPIDSLFLFGEQLLSLSFADRKMKAWHAATSELIGEVVFEDDFTPSCITHPHTYLNKVVIGSREGHVEIWNTRTLKRIFRSGSTGTANCFRSDGTSIACIEQSPALDVLGLGLADGRAILYNIKFDEVLGTFTDSEAARDGGITCLAFHAGGLADVASKSGKGSAKAPSLVTGSANGKVRACVCCFQIFLAHCAGVLSFPISARHRRVLIVSVTLSCALDMHAAACCVGSWFTAVAVVVADSSRWTSVRSRFFARSTAAFDSRWGQCPTPMDFRSR